MSNSEENGLARAIIQSTYASVESNLAKSSERASTAVRALALSAVAIVWLLAGGLTSGPGDALAVLRGTSALGTAMTAAIGCLALDAMQYIWVSLSLAVYRWALWNVLHNDKIDPSSPLAISKTDRVAWGILGLFLMQWHLREALSLDMSINYQELRQRLANDQAGDASTAKPYYASVIFETPEAVLFFLKIVSVIVSYCAILVAIV